jgi:hypothetical protein
MSRDLLDIGRLNRKREPGLGLVNTGPSPTNLRTWMVHLTAKGRTLTHAIACTLRR